MPRETILKMETARMPIRPHIQKHLIVQFFDNGEDIKSRDCVLRIEQAGHSVISLPTSGPPRLWVEGFEVVGRSAISELADNLIHKSIE